MPENPLSAAMKLDPKLVEAAHNAEEWAFADGALPAKVKILMAMAFDAACRKASPILLEPIMAVDVLSPSEFLGDVIGNLNARQGLIVNVESKPGADHVKAQAPLVSMFGYSTALRSATQGRATFTMEFSHFAEKVGGFGDSR